MPFWLALRWYRNFVKLCYGHRIPSRTEMIRMFIRMPNSFNSSILQTFGVLVIKWSFIERNHDFYRHMLCVLTNTGAKRARRSIPGSCDTASVVIMRKSSALTTAEEPLRHRRHALSAISRQTSATSCYVVPWEWVTRSVLYETLEYSINECT